MEKVVSNLKYPMLTFLITGAVIGLLASYFISSNAERTISEYREMNKLVISEYRTKLEKQKVEIDRITAENSKLREHTKIIKVRQPDGTISETTEKLVESETHIEEKWKSKYELDLRTELSKVREHFQDKLDSEIRSRSKFGIYAGIDREYVKYGLITYDLWGPVSLLLSANSENNYIFGLGLRL